MSNTLENFTPEIWSNKCQSLLQNNLVSGAIANTEERAVLNYGDTVHRPYHSEVYAQDYTKGTAFTNLDVATTDESLTVNKAKVIPIYMDEIDDIQNKYKTMSKLSERSGYELRDLIDRAVLAEVANAGLSNSAVTLSTSNIISQFSGAKAALNNNGCEMDRGVYAVIDPDTSSIIEQLTAVNGFKVADRVLDNGWGAYNYMGRFLGVDTYVSQNCLSTAVMSMVTQVTEGDTVTINGVVFTFNATPSGAGSVDIGGTVDISRANLAAAINDSGTAGTTYIQLSDADRAKLKRRGVTATNDNSADTLTITAGGKLVLGKTLTDATDAWTSNKIDTMFGQYGNVDLVVQAFPKTIYKDVPDKIGKNIVTWTHYGTKTFREGAQRMFRLSASQSVS